MGFQRKKTKNQNNKSKLQMKKNKLKKTSKKNIKYKKKFNPKNPCRLSNNSSINHEETGIGTINFEAGTSHLREKCTLRERMMKRLEAAKFRQLNEELDTNEDTDPRNIFNSNISAFEGYHKAFKERVSHWPEDPLDLIIQYLKKKIPTSYTVADFGCGEGRLAQSIPHKTYSFDLFALNEFVTPCDMSSTPLSNQSIDVAIFCLSLMGTEVGKFIVEANRVLKQKGILRIAEVSSRFPKNNPIVFIKKMKRFGFIPNENTKNFLKKCSNEKQSIFFMLEFTKIRPVSLIKGKYPSLKLHPCTYKKR